MTDFRFNNIHTIMFNKTSCFKKKKPYLNNLILTVKKDIKSGNFNI